LGLLGDNGGLTDCTEFGKEKSESLAGMFERRMEAWETIANEMQGFQIRRLRTKSQVL